MGSEQRNALLAVVLSGLILFGWQYFFAPPKPEGAPIEPVTTSTGAPGTSSIGESRPTAGPIEPVTSETFALSRGGVRVEFDSQLGIVDFENAQAQFSFTDTVGVPRPMRLEFDFGQGFRQISFVRQEENKFFNAEFDVTAVTSMNEQGVVSFSLVSTRDFRYRFLFKSEEKKLENNQQRYFAFFTDELNHADIIDDETGDRTIKWSGIDFNYHLFAVYFDKERPLLYKSYPEGTFGIFSNQPGKTLEYNSVFVKKEYNYLSSLGHNLKNSIDFGIWGFFAVWILKGLQFFYTFVPNYGVSIILLTLLIRIITFPLQYKSVVSMKKLQLVQPELTKIREKFKDDPQRLQKESMDLFRRSGANPIGGCLPLLLQMPIFFAFYKVLHSAVELVDAPFMLWIQDLSNKDPYFVLPVLMAGAMFLQQKLTPNTITDPVQKKVMMFMPLIFGFIMKDLPSGLSLYIFVSTVFGILQQLLVFNSKSSAKPVVV